ncbi:MAG: hypothetical protein M1817_003760 [Caeruleum heppii]|nr:MAG: hypothetical protein M1817_003760 [Caeruleum heppii]
MGVNSSKPASQSSQHVFASETPLRFSQELIDSLQESPETDSTREKSHELHIQNRVAEELRLIEERESQALKEIEQKISSEPDPSDVGQGHDGKLAQAKIRGLGRESVQKEITLLKQKLESRKRLEDLDKGVERAKDDVVRCLRVNDRRPLDCWKEVEAFKREVGRMEDAFVDKALH